MTQHLTPEQLTVSEPPSVQVSFPGGAAIDADYRGFTIRTDQDEKHGGQSTGPKPFDLFLVSIATCAGHYALQFLNNRKISTEGLAISLLPVRSADGKRIDTMQLQVELPPDFPEKYSRALERSIDQCAVKRHIIDAPSFEITLS